MIQEQQNSKMIQEQATKIISKNLYQSLTGHFFREFTSKLQLEINKEPITGGMVNEFRSGNHGKSSINNRMETNNSGYGASPAPILKQNNLIDSMQIDQRGVTKNQAPARTLQFQNDESQELARDMEVTQNTQLNNKKRDALLDHAVGLAPANKSINKKLQYEDELNHTGTLKNDGYLQAILKMIEERVGQAPIHSATAIGLKALQATRTPNNLTTMKSQGSVLKQAGTFNIQELALQDQSQYDPTGGRGFMRIGDIIIISYDEKVYDDLGLMGGGADKLDLDNNDNHLAMEQMAARDNLKARITRKPDLEYKGIIFSDGVTDKAFTILPRQMTGHHSAFTHFKKTLFRVEIAQECKFNIIKQNYLEELEELERERSMHNEERALSGKGGSLRRGNKELEEIDRLEKEIERVEKILHENEKHLQDEMKNNSYEFQINIGKKVTYGQKIMFKHIFSDQYLTLNNKKISHEHGCVTLQLSPPNENSWFTIIPSEKIKCLGQSIGYLDTFLIQNFVQSAFEKPLFYVHVNASELIKKGTDAVLEVNGSYEQSKFRARLFMDFKHMKFEKSYFESGDVLRLMHKEAQGYITVHERDVELGLQEMPDFLQRQMNKNQGLSHDNNNMNIQGDHGGGDAELKEQAKMKQAQTNEMKRKNQNKIFIERNMSNLQFTNSCWEIQKVKTYQGGAILLNEMCRLRHIGTGKYLSVSNIDKRELVLKENTDSSDTLFRIRRDTYRPIRQSTDDSQSNGGTVNPHDLVILETFQQSYIHISETIKEEFSLLTGGDSQGDVAARGGTGINANKQGPKKDEKNDKEANQEGGKDTQTSTETKVNDNQDKIETVCGYFSKDDQSKMIFMLEEVTGKDDKMPYQASSFFNALSEFYNFLNFWGVADIDEEELELMMYDGVTPDMIDKQKYDFLVARETDGELLQAADEIEHAVIDQIIGMIMRAKEIGHDTYATIQKHLAEQGILVMSIKILELIYYKCVTPQQRDRDLLGVETGAINDLEERPELIARELLDPLAEKILRLLYLLIKMNKDNAEKVTRYDHVIYMMFTRYDTKLCSKIFKETYKRAQHIHGDQNQNQGEVVQSADLTSAIGSQLASNIFGNIMAKWTDRLETVRFERSGQENISKQILYLHVISMMCRDSEGNGLYNYQMQAVRSLLDNPFKVPITFGLQKKSIDRPIIFINKKPEESDEIFLQNNPLLRDVYKQHKTIGTGGVDQPSSICIDLYELTAKNLSQNGRLQPYLDYIAAVITMYCHFCLSRNSIAVKKLKDIGLTFDHVIASISQQGEGGKKKSKTADKTEPLDKKLIASYIFAARVMYIDVSLFPQLQTYHNRCYFWQTVHDADAHKTMYRWEKNKFFRGFEDNNRFLKEEQDQHEAMAMGQLRETVYHFFSDMPDVLQTFLYSYESRRYTKRDVTAVLTLMFNFVDAATSLIACELVDSKFIYRMLQSASVIFISYHYNDMPHTEEDKSWIYMVLQVAKKTKRCREKIEILEYKTLKMLEIICKYRMNAQILIFLQLFRTFVEKNQLPNVSQATNGFDSQYQVIFQLYQFNIGKNMTFKTIERMSKKTLIQGVVAQKGANKKKLEQAKEAADDDNDPNNRLLQIGEIKLTEDHGDGEDQGEEINDAGEVIKRGGKKTVEIEADDDMSDDGEVLGGENRGERARRRKQFNDKYELDKFLLYLIFAKQTNQGIRKQAAKVLVQNFNQREALMQELTKIELLISAQDQQDYNGFMQQHFMVQGLIERLSQLINEMKAAGGNGRARDVFTYQRSIEDLTNILKGLTSNLQDHVNTILISAGEELIIEQEQARLLKKQNMLRHMDIANDLIEILMLRITSSGSYRKDKHGELFKEISRFLFMYSCGNLSNQRTLVKHLNYLVSLTDLDVPTPKLVAQVLSQQRETEHGLLFLEFLTDKILHTAGDSFKSSLFKLLALMMGRPLSSSSSGAGGIINIEANQVFVLKRLVKKTKFRKELLMDENTSKHKIDIIVNLNQRIKELKGFQQMTKADQTSFVSQEWEAMHLHVSVIDLLSSCVRSCLFGRLQARKLVSAEVLFDSILSEAVPFLLRRKYLRLLFEIYIRALPEDTLHIDFNTQMFYDMMFYVVFEDLRQYARYYLGLLSKPVVEATRSNDTEALRKRTQEQLAQRSVEDVRKRNMERSRQEMENFKENRGKLSQLHHSQPIPLIDETDRGEYWKYLTQYKKSRNEADGLLHFIADFYHNIKKTHGKKMTKELVEITVKIREILMEMSDDLHKINERYGEHLSNVDLILIVIDEALASIPNVRTFTAGKKFSVKGGGGDADIQIIQDEGEQEEEEDDHLENEDEEIDDDKRRLMAEKRKQAREEADDSRNLDVKMASDKLLNIIRDTIVADGTTIRDLFRIKNFEQNYIMRKLDLKKLMKQIVGSQATNDEIEMFMQFLDKFSREETEQRRTIQPDIANEGHIRIRMDPLKVLQTNNAHSMLINFRDLENLLKKALQKLQYKPPVQKRGREQMEEALNLEMMEDDLSRACNTDLKLFTKCFFDFFQRFKNRDEIADIVTKIKVMFNDAFETEESKVIKKFIQNIMQAFAKGQDKIYLLRILNMIIDHYLPSNIANKRIQVKAKARLQMMQVIMKDCGLLTLLLDFISQDDIKVSDEAIKLLCNLLCESNLEVQDFLLDMMKHNRDNFKFFTFLKDRMHKASDFLIKEVESKLIQKRLAIESTKHYKDPRIESLYNLYQQPFYLPSQAQNGQSVFNLETEIKKLTSQQNSAELLNILRLVQMLCDNCHSGFQDFLRNQEENAFEGYQPLTTVNIVSEVATILIKLTEKLGQLIFSEYILFETISQIFDTLIDFLHGPNIENQRLLGGWKKLSKAINFYLSQNLGLYAANTTEQKAKLSIMKSCTDLLLALVESVDLDFRLAILNEMVPEISIQTLKQKMVDIFHFKIGGDSKRERTYYSNKKCHHYRSNTLTKRVNMCEKDEFCEFGNLIRFDKQIIAAGFNIFIFLFNYKAVDPNCEALKQFDSEFKNDDLYNKMRKVYENDIQQSYNVSVEMYAKVLENSEIEIEEEVQRKTELILQQMTIKDPTTKIFPELARKENLSGGGGEDKGDMENNVFDMENEDGQTKGKKADAARKKKANELKKDKICFCFNRRTKKTNKVGGHHSAHNASGHNLLIDSFDILALDHNDLAQMTANANPNDQHLVAAVSALHENLEAEAEDKYTPDQFKMDQAIRFYVSNVANIEINYKGSLSKVMFRIPPFCTFFTATSQKKMIYEANHESHIEKLEDFFNKKKIFKAEMKAIQRLARRSKVLRWVSQQWKGLSNVSLLLVLLINILFMIFYTLDGEEVNLAYPSAEVAIELLGIFQAFIAFLVMAAYIMRYHGKIYEEYLEQFKIDTKESFSKVKGSLGYAFGQEVYKLSHQAAAQQNSQQNDKTADDELTLERNRQKLNRQELVYAIKIFFLSMKNDTQHAFNVIYFILSILGVFYHTIFSFLLLDIVIKIPLLQNVVQAIVQNRYQLMYTFLLLFVIVYIYAFIAFRILRDSFWSVDSEGEDNAPDQNLYCSTLLECFTSTLNNGLRAGGGIGDILNQPSLITDQHTYWVRYAFDMSFYFLVIILLLNLIFGIIIDAFADMRDARNSIESDVKERCFICGLGRFEFETKNKSWTDHIQKEHNAFAYLYFILLVQHKPGNQCSGVEKYVKSLVLKEDPSFFPVGKCLSIGVGVEPELKE